MIINKFRLYDVVEVKYMVTYQLINKDNIVLEFIKTDTLEGQFKIIKEYESVAWPYLISENSNELDTWLGNEQCLPTENI